MSLSLLPHGDKAEYGNEEYGSVKKRGKKKENSTVQVSNPVFSSLLAGREGRDETIDSANKNNGNSHENIKSSTETKKRGREENDENHHNVSFEGEGVQRSGREGGVKRVRRQQAIIGQRTPPGGK